MLTVVADVISRLFGFRRPPEKFEFFSGLARSILNGGGPGSPIMPLGCGYSSRNHPDLKISDLGGSGLQALGLNPPFHLRHRGS